MQISNNRLAFGKVYAYCLIIAGLGVISFFGIGVAAFTDLHLTGEENQIVPLVLCLCFVCFGAWLFYLGQRRNRLIANCKKYFGAVASGKVGTIEKLAAITGQQSSQVSRNIDKMLGLGYIKGIYINKETGHIVVLDDVYIEREEAPFDSWSSYTPAQKPATVSVTCKACGGITVLTGHRSGVCEYCGSKIEA